MCGEGPGDPEGGPESPCNKTPTGYGAEGSGRTKGEEGTGTGGIGGRFRSEFVMHVAILEHSVFPELLRERPRVSHRVRATMAAMKEAMQAGGAAGADPVNVRAGSPTAAETNEIWYVEVPDCVADRYAIFEALGQGGYATVCRCRDQLANKDCAVKIVDKLHFRNWQIKSRTTLSLLSEARVLGQLTHPNIIKCHVWFEAEHSLFLFVDLMDGGDMLHYIQEKGAFKEATARRLFQTSTRAGYGGSSGIAWAVRHLHERNIVHRDLKPENILLTSMNARDMVPKLADFGHARTSVYETECMTICGTRGYMSPEIVALAFGSGGGYGKPADMWSLGVVLYVMLCGSPPFEDARLREQIQRGAYEFDVPVWEEVSTAAKDLVNRLMEVDPAVRLTIQETMLQDWLGVGLRDPAAAAEVEPLLRIVHEPVAPPEDRPWQEVHEEDWQRRTTKRCGIVAFIKTLPEYNFCLRYADAMGDKRPTTPDPTCRRTSKRRWEQAVGIWRASLQKAADIILVGEPPANVRAGRRSSARARANNGRAAGSAAAAREARRRTARGTEAHQPRGPVPVRSA